MMAVVPNAFSVSSSPGGNSGTIAWKTGEETSIAGGDAKGDNNATAIGRNSTNPAYNSSRAWALGAIVIGTASKVGNTGQDENARGGIAIGFAAPTQSKHGVTIGSSAATSGEGATVIGSDSNASSFSTALGRSSKASASAQWTTAIGATVADNNTYSIALGSGSAANGTNSVEDLKFNYDSNTARTANVTAQTVGSVLSIGNRNHKRQIVNVAAGRVNQDLTDAVIGSQLYAVMTHSCFNIKENDSPKSRINNNGQVDFANGNYTTASVTDGSNSAAVKVNVVTQDISTDNKGVTSVSGTSGLTTAKTVYDAINNALNNSSFTLKANSDAGTAIKRNGYIDIKSGKNVNVSRDGSVIIINTVDNPTFTDVTTNNLTAKEQISGKNLTVSGTSNLQAANVNQQFSANSDVSLGVSSKTVTFVSGSSINTGSNRISGVATGTDKTDAVNKGQLDDAISNITNTTNTAVNAANNANTTANNANATANNGTTTTKDLSVTNNATIVKDLTVN
ncbi:hypothetical protein [Rodentibacter caecimuris]|uniref:hypothetical protein n=1 Tax=Rodentibacter caecimuris TaxID=1796644 RepID=UPI0013A08C60|nr:hypothetical protein [Rodentibacter heylii]QIA77873.1 hypothetical protein FEE42_11275 [Rodentibacter heylii]